MNRTQIERKVNLVLDDCLGISLSQIDSNSLLNADFGVDSIDEVELVVELERKFGIKIEADEMFEGEDWTIGEVYDLVERKLNKN